MSVDASDLVEPTGFLTPSLFPNADANALLARVGAYLDAAPSDVRVAEIIGADATKTDQACTAYAYWRAYSAVFQRMNSEPLTVNVTEKGSHAYKSDQIGAFQQLVQKYDDALNAMLPPADEPVTQASTLSVPNAFGW